MHPNPDTVEPNVNRKNPKNVMLKKSRESVDLTARGRPLTARSGKAKSIETNSKERHAQNIPESVLISQLGGVPSQLEDVLEL